jgi:hypothetical protein
MTFLPAVISFVQLFLAHPLHVSVTEIAFQEQKKSLEIMMRVFADDLEETLRSDLRQPELDIAAPKNGQTTDQMIDNYLKKHFKIIVDAKELKAGYLGHEREGEAFIFFIEVTNLKKLKTIEIKNDIITELYEDQSNLVHVTVNKVVKSLRLTRDTPADKLTFDIK